ncbi:MAG: DUF4382 domain-containing protein [Gemmatimonadales bacterium]|nr:DUF4382 domain-containing protein [Gemmatimonadales bacterium]
MLHSMLLSGTRRSAAALAVALAALAACGDGAGPGETTALSLKLTDAPGDIQHAFVTITEINLMGSDGKVVLRDTPFTADLLTLAGTTADLVTDADVPSGTYTGLRFVISGACLAVENESGGSDIYTTAGYDSEPCGGAATGVLQAPSFAQSGLKVTLDANALVILGPKKILLVDFDVQQSFGRVAGQSGRWVMHPVVTGGEIEPDPGVDATP